MLPPRPTTALPGRGALAATLGLVLALLGAVPAQALSDRRGRGGRDEVRVSGSCGAGASSHLKLKQDSGGIEVEFEVDHNRVGASWRVVIVQERRVVWRGSARTRSPSGSFEVSRLLRDLPGGDRISARAWGPRGVTCEAAATLPGP